MATKKTITYFLILFLTPVLSSCDVIYTQTKHYFHDKHLINYQQQSDVVSIQVLTDSVRITNHSSVQYFVRSFNPDYYPTYIEKYNPTNNQWENIYDIVPGDIYKASHRLIPNREITINFYQTVLRKYAVKKIGTGNDKYRLKLYFCDKFTKQMYYAYSNEFHM